MMDHYDTAFCGDIYDDTDARVATPGVRSSPPSNISTLPCCVSVALSRPLPPSSLLGLLSYLVGAAVEWSNYDAEEEKVMISGSKKSPTTSYRTTSGFPVSETRFCQTKHCKKHVLLDPSGDHLNPTHPPQLDPGPFTSLWIPFLQFTFRPSFRPETATV